MRLHNLYMYSLATLFMRLMRFATDISDTLAKTILPPHDYFTSRLPPCNDKKETLLQHIQAAANERYAHPAFTKWVALFGLPTLTYISGNAYTMIMENELVMQRTFVQAGFLGTLLLVSMLTLYGGIGLAGGLSYIIHRRMTRYLDDSIQQLEKLE